jgi:hypothetical protein
MHTDNRMKLQHSFKVSAVFIGVHRRLRAFALFSANSVAQFPIHFAAYTVTP